MDALTHTGSTLLSTTAKPAVPAASSGIGYAYYMIELDNSTLGGAQFTFDSVTAYHQLTAPALTTNDVGAGVFNLQWKEAAPTGFLTPFIGTAGQSGRYMVTEGYWLSTQMAQPPQVLTLGWSGADTAAIGPTGLRTNPTATNITIDFPVYTTGVEFVPIGTQVLPSWEPLLNGNPGNTPDTDLHCLWRILIIFIPG